MRPALKSSLTMLASLLLSCDGGAGRGRGGDGAVGSEDGGAGFDAGADAFVPATEPETCAEAAASKSYVGCDYWPTVTANGVWSVFDFAVVVANVGTTAAAVEVTGPGGVHKQVTVAPATLQKVYLPWVASLKGPDTNECTIPNPITQTVRAARGAYHLVSDRPVIVYQFNALEFKGEGGEPGKDWSSCPGSTTVCKSPSSSFEGKLGCFSFSNDASLLLPTSAMTGDYRVAGLRATNPALGGPAGFGAYVAITATQDATVVKVLTSATGEIEAGGGLGAVAPSGTTSFSLDAGDVIELVAKVGTGIDLSGSLVQANKPVQVIAGISCIANPLPSCDHAEEVVMPAQTLGKRYLVNRPTGPQGSGVRLTVRFIGNRDGTHLTYSSFVPGAPATLDAGQVVEVDPVNTDFLVEGDHEFIVVTLQKSGSVVDPGAPERFRGDPSLSMAVSIEQYRYNYVFLAPDDYEVNFADVTAPAGVTLRLDGQPVSVAGSPIAGTTYLVYRLALGPGLSGAHTLEADQPVGVQVLGYGAYTSYQYPGGLQLANIAPPPPPIP